MWQLGHGKLIYPAHKLMWTAEWRGSFGGLQVEKERETLKQALDKLKAQIHESEQMRITQVLKYKDFVVDLVVSGWVIVGGAGARLPRSRS